MTKRREVRKFILSAGKNRERGIRSELVRREKQERGLEIRRRLQEIKELEKQKKSLEKEKAI